MQCCCLTDARSHRVSGPASIAAATQDFPQIPEDSPHTPPGAAPVTVMEQGGREEGRRLAGGLIPLLHSGEAGANDGKNSPRPAHRGGISPSRPEQRDGTLLNAP